MAGRNKSIERKNIVHEVEFNLDEETNFLIDLISTKNKRFGIGGFIEDKLRLSYIKINSLKRSEVNNLKLNKTYQVLLSKYKNIFEDDSISSKGHISSINSLLNDLDSLELDSGEKLSETLIDGGFSETVVGIKDAMLNSIDEILDNFKVVFELFQDPSLFSDFASKVKALLFSTEALLNIFDKLYLALKEEGSDFSRDINLIINNSTPNGKIVELSSFFSEKGIEKVFELIPIIKIIKLLGITNIFPDNVLKVVSKGKQALGKAGVKRQELVSMVKMRKKETLSIPTNLSVLAKRSKQLYSKSLIPEEVIGEISESTGGELLSLINEYEDISNLEKKDS